MGSDFTCYSHKDISCLSPSKNEGILSWEGYLLNHLLLSDENCSVSLVCLQHVSAQRLPVSFHTRNMSKHLLSTNQIKSFVIFQSSSKSCSWQAAIPVGTVCPNPNFHWKKKKHNFKGSSFQSQCKCTAPTQFWPLLAMINAGVRAWKAASANPTVDSSLSSAHL